MTDFYRRKFADSDGFDEKNRHKNGEPSQNRHTPETLDFPRFFTLILSSMTVMTVLKSKIEIK